VVNSDIAFYPGILQRIAKQVEKNIHQNPKFGEIDGSKDYLSGVFASIYLQKDQKNPAVI